MTAIGHALAAALDPVALAADLGITPDPWQAKLLRSTAPRVIVLKARQVGGSTVVGLVALHRALYVSGSLVLIVAPTERQASELQRVVTAFYRRLGRPIPASGESATMLTLENGSRIGCLPATENVRGFASVDLLILDEASRIPDDVMAVVRPMVAVSNGRILALSTPAGPRGWFWQAWEGRADDGARPEPWERYQVTVADCPRLTPAFLESERAALGSWRYRSEYGCEFVAADDALFSADDLDAVFSAVA